MGYPKLVRKALKGIGFKQKRIGIFTLCFLVLEIFAIGEVILALNTSRTYEFFDAAYAYSWEFPPLGPNETGHSVPIVISRGQRAFINVSTTNTTSLKLIPVTSAWEMPPFTDFSPYSSLNTSHHFFFTPPEPAYTVYFAYLGNFGNESIVYTGFIQIHGLNLDYLIIPFWILGIYVFIVLAYFIIGRIFRIFSKKHQSRGMNVSPSTRYRFLKLWELQGREFGISQTIIGTALMWLVVQPMVTLGEFSLYGYFLSSQVSIHDLLEAVELRQLTPLFIGLVFFIVLISLETAEVFAAKKARRDIMLTFSLPIGRSEWVMGAFLWRISYYGGLFVILFVGKSILLSLQIGFFYPLISLSMWLTLFGISFAAWIATGLLASTVFSSRLNSAITGLSASFLLTLLISIMVNPAKNEGNPFGASRGAGGGVFNAISMVWDMWPAHIEVQGMIVHTLPNVTQLVASILLTVVWFVTFYALAHIYTQRSEVI
ncbi:MAG: ABC transporter permease [Candidatus Thorarchaeota archaeon]